MIDGLADIIERFGLLHLRSSLGACRELSGLTAPLGVAVFGQFKSGKSSLLNALIGQESSACAVKRSVGNNDRG